MKRLMCFAVLGALFSSQASAVPQGGLPSILPLSMGGNGTSTPALTAGAGVAISGAWPNYTIGAASGGIAASMLASGAAAANLSAGGYLPNLSTSVEGSGLPGLDGGNFFVWNSQSAVSLLPTMRADRHANSGVGNSGGWVYPTFVANSSNNPNEVGFEWTILAQQTNYANASTASENVALQGTITKAIPTSWAVATTGASGTGTAATVTFSGGATIPVGHSVLVAGMTPSGYNGTYKVTASSAGSVTFASATTGAQTVAGTIVDISVGASWGMDANCILATGENDPVMPCIGAELGVTNNEPSPTTDAHANRVGLQIYFNGTSSNAGSHAGTAIKLGTGNNNIWDTGILFQQNYGNGIDLSGATITGSSLLVPGGAPIASTGNMYLNAQNGNSLYFQISGSTDWMIGSGYGGAFVPNADGARNIGTATLEVGVTYTQTVQLHAYTVSTLPSCSSSSAGAIAYVTDASSPTYNGALTGGSSTKTLAMCNGSAWTAH